MTSTIVSFWCQECKLDQDLEAEIAYYFGGKEKFVAECEKCGRKLMRLLDDKVDDPYYLQSKRVKINRDKHCLDTLQLGEVGFQSYYRNSWLKLEKQKEEYEINQAKKIKEKDEYYKKLRGHGGENRSFAKKVLEIEERMDG